MHAPNESKSPFLCPMTSTLSFVSSVSLNDVALTLALTLAFVIFDADLPPK